MSQAIASTELTADAADPVVVSEGDPRRSRAATIVMVVVAFAVAVWLIYRLRDTTFFFDEWDVLLRRRDTDLDAFLRDHNGHLYVAPFVIYRTFLAIFGAGSYLPWVIASVSVHAAIGVTVFVITRRYVDTVAGFCAAAVVLMLGRGSIDFVWPFQIGFLLSIGASMWMFLALEEQGRRRDFIAMGCAVLALASSGIGIPIIVGAAARLLAERGHRTRVWVLGPPVALYGVWYLIWGTSSGATSQNVRLAPGYVGRAAAAAVGGVMGLAQGEGRFVLGAAVALALVVIVARRTVPAGAIMFGVTMMAFWIATALTRAQVNDPDSGRYVYVGTVFAILFAATLWDHYPVPVIGHVALVVLAVVSLWNNVPFVNAHIDGQVAESYYSRAELGALESIRDAVPAEMRPDLVHFPQIYAGEYFAADDEYGIATAGPAEIASATPEVRVQVDRILAEVMVANAVPADAASACAVASPEGTVVVVNRGSEVASLDLQGFADIYSLVADLAPGAAQRYTVPAGFNGPDVRFRTRGSAEWC